MQVGRQMIAMLMGGLLALATTPAPAQDAGGYGVACADRAYFSNETRGSPVELYVRIDAPQAAQAFLQQTTGGAPAPEVDEVLVLHTPDGGAQVGVVPFSDGCALDAGFLGQKMVIDQVLAGMLHDGLID